MTQQGPLAPSGAAHVRWGGVLRQEAAEGQVWEFQDSTKVSVQMLRNVSRERGKIISSGCPPGIPSGWARGLPPVFPGGSQPLGRAFGMDE